MNHKGKRMKTHRLGLLALLAMIALPALGAESATGKWVASVDAGEAAVELTFDLKAEGEKLTGSLSVMGAPPAPIKEGAVKGEDIRFKLDFDSGMGGPPVVISYTAKLKGDELNIQSSLVFAEGAEPLITDFVAKRAK